MELYANQSVQEGNFCVGGVDVLTLAEKYGTPLYVMDEDLIRKNCRAFNNEMVKHLGDDTLVVYASKAFCTLAMCRIMKEEGLGLDVVSGGELYTAIQADFPPEKIYFHGNNKTADEIIMALEYGVSRFVVDNLFELHLLNDIAIERGVKANISFRIKPGVEAHTHEAIMTGQIDSKFGVALENGEAFEIIKTASELKGVTVEGIHCHIGSQIFGIDPYLRAVDIMMDFMNQVKTELGIEIRELNLGGGYGIKYTNFDDPPEVSTYIEQIAAKIEEKCSHLYFRRPRIVIEPGRAIVGPAGVTLYTVGSVKKIKGIRTYVSIDGGMADNPRYALYQSEYSALVANKADKPRDTKITLAGRCCESGDLIGKDMLLQTPQAGDIIAVLSTGAYNYSMASNYNRLPKPPVVFLSGGKDRLAVKRETYDDIIKNDI